jgi:alkylhydroperoxidase family enzyme
MILRCAQLAHNEYQWRDHHAMALDAGVSPDQIEALVRWASSSRFDDQERLLLRFTDEVVSGHATADVLAQLREQYGPDELVELTLTAAFYVMVPRVLDALRVPRSES